MKFAQGIFGDPMHLLHLATYPDILHSVLLDLSDGSRREQDLTDLWEAYKSWCDGQGVGGMKSGVLDLGTKK